MIIYIYMHSSVQLVFKKWIEAIIIKGSKKMGLTD